MGNKVIIQCRRAGAAVALVLSLTACSVDELVTQRLGAALAQQNMGQENDLQLAREASAFYLKLSEAVLAQNPANAKLAEALAASLTQYSFAFVSQEADFIEANQPVQAAQLRQRAARLYERAYGHAWRALSERYPDLTLQLRQGAGNPLQVADVGLAYWTAAAWAGWIALSTDEPERVADLPQAVELARWAWQRQADFGQGALSGLMGTLEAARPGGSLVQAQGYFDQSIAQSGGLSAAAYVSKAERWAVKAHARDEFVSLLKQAQSIQTPAGHPFSLANQVMQARAQWLLTQVDEWF